jgi:hypothetical protein
MQPVTATRNRFDDCRAIFLLEAGGRSRRRTAIFRPPDRMTGENGSRKSEQPNRRDYANSNTRKSASRSCPMHSGF